MTLSSVGIQTVRLSQTGEIVALGILEINSIRHFSILGGMEHKEEILKCFQMDFAGLLSGIHQHYKQGKLTAPGHLFNLELMWVSQAAENQPFKAVIRLFLIARAISPTESQATESVSVSLEICMATLKSQGYETQSLRYDELDRELARIQTESVLAIVRDARLENLQNQLLPQCLVYDRLPVAWPDMGRIANILTNCPGCAISFQLNATEFTGPEAALIDNTSRRLATLAGGVQAPGLGTVANPLAERPAATYGYYSSRKNDPVFAFNIIVFGDKRAANAIAILVHEQINAGVENRTGLVHLSLSPAQVNLTGNFYPLPWAVDAMLLSSTRYPGAFAGAERLSRLITAEEASNFFRLPIGGGEVSAGLTVSTSERRERTYSGAVINGADVGVGFLRTSGQDEIGFMLKDLTKHMFVTGTPGSGKTSFLVGLLDRLWNKHRIPFLIIEPAKNEYRALLRHIPDLQLFTPGKSGVSPFLYNPFVPPKNVKLEAYKPTLKTAFAAAATMTSPLDRILEDSLHNCYSDFYWLDSYTSADGGRVFNIQDFIACFQKTFDAIGYTGEARNIGQAGVVRLKGMTSLFDNYGSIPIQDLLEKPTIIELAAVENPEQKALIIALLLLSILAYVNANYQSADALRNVLLLEEAHVLLDADVNRLPGDANPGGIAQSLIKRMLAEVRAYGLGMVVADQSPRKVTADVVAMTDIKLAFRLVEAEDRRMIADSTNMSGVQAERLGRLKPGGAFLFFQHLEEPEEIFMGDYRREHGIPLTISDEDARKESTYWADKQRTLRPYPECGMTRCCKEDCDKEKREIAREFARRIFNKYLPTRKKDIKALEAMFSFLPQEMTKALGGKPFTDRLYACTKVHLFRMIRYQTPMVVSEDTIRTVLGRE